MAESAGLPVQTPVLTGHGVRLEPLSEHHAPALERAAADGRLWELFFTNIPKPGGMATKVAGLLAQRDRGETMPFVVRVSSGEGGALDGGGEVVGVTTLLHLDWVNRRGEIGNTWYAASHQGTGLNSAAKLLLLEYAFDELGFIAVEFRTHWFNHRSRRAIAGLGAKQDGVLRSHSIARDGTIRDTVVFSIIAGEWPAVRSHLRRRLGLVADSAGGRA